jgi:hypothetical protein
VGDASAPSPLLPVVRGSLTAPLSLAAAPLPVYHLHGYLRSPSATGATPEVCDTPGDASDVLVFTDLQYWASAAIPSSHMNRTFSFALHDSHCVFIGTSMVDLNIWRWLALRTFEVAADSGSQSAKSPSEQAARLYRESLDRHYWVTSSDQESAFLSNSLALRGVRTVRISGWRDESLYALLDDCFGM